jgi:hypothetical protein
MFAGRQLNDDDMQLLEYNVQKECTIQAFAKSLPAGTEPEPIPATMPTLARSVSSKQVAFGDVLFAKVCLAAQFVF